MISLQASEIAEIVGGELFGRDVAINSNPVINSAEAEPGSLFIAIRGERVDGHDFAKDAISHGAVMVLASRAIDEPHILVDDTVKALGVLAHEVRRRLSNLTVIAVTGSQGKTTSKELMYSVLSQDGPTVAPRGNFNNEIGAPLSLLRCDDKTKYCIVEMGARHIGDISALCAIAEPNIGVVLRVGAAHVGEFGGIEKVALAKSEMISSLADNSVAILGTYDSFTPAMAKLHQGRVITFGESNGVDIRATDIEPREGRAHFDLVTPAGRALVGLRLLGLHQVANALAAAAVACEVGMSVDAIAGALSMADSQATMRMELHELPDLAVINDTYNASPDSMEAALRTLVLIAQERGGQSWAFLGAMRELGDTSAHEHRKIGLLARDLRVDHLVCVATPEFAGELTSDGDISVHLCANQEEALKLAEELNRGDIVLLKGSRSERLELLCEEIEAMWLRKVGSA